jgi:cadmium resistance protein CadD (predicted permease)
MEFYESLREVGSMDNHSKKKVAPIVITVIMVIYYFLYFAFVVAALPMLLKLAFGVIPLALGITMILVCRQRLKEIDGGEEDDLGKY